MEALPDIRQLFKPVQPTVKGTDNSVRYEEAAPDARLGAYIYCYWQLRTLRPLTEPFFYRVVADGCIDLFFDAAAPDDNYIMGFSSAYTEFPLQHTFHYTGVRFLPAAFPLLFNIDAAALTNRFEHLAQVLPALSRGLARIAEAETGMEKLRPLLDHYFLQTLSNTQLKVDGRLFDAIGLILRSQGTLQTEGGLGTGASPRQMRRLFNFYIGDTPKTFSKVVRFQHILQARPSVESLRRNKLFYDAGYYDQAHFIKEFRTLYGLTPVMALQ